MIRMSSLAAAAVHLVLLTGVAAGHHSFPGAYDVDTQSTMEGVVTEYMFRNPHVFILMRVDGGDEVWAFELPPAVALSRRGLGADWIKIGERLLITCNPARDQSRSCGVGQRGGIFRAHDEFVYGLDPRTVN